MAQFEFIGLDEREKYFDTVREVEGGTVSPGGAAAILRVSREAIWGLIKRGTVRAWQYYARKGKMPEMVDVSVRDLVRHGVRQGRIARYEDVGLRGYLVEREVNLALGVDEEERAMVD